MARGPKAAGKAGSLATHPGALRRQTQAFAPAPVTVPRYLGAASLSYAVGVAALFLLHPGLSWLGVATLVAAIYPAHWLFRTMRPPKGWRRFERAQKGLHRGEAAAEQELQRLWQEAPSPEIQIEAAGELALLALERGQWRQAVELLSCRESDWEQPRRRRYYGRGTLGETLRSIVECISPGTFSDRRLASADLLGAKVEFWWQTHHPLLRRHHDLLALLRLLEAGQSEDASARTRALQRVMSSSIAQTAGGLVLPALSLLGRALPAAHALLRSELAEDREGRKLELLQHFDPSFELPPDEHAPYRQAASEVSESHTALLRVTPPAELQPYVEAAVPAQRLAAARRRGIILTTPLGALCGSVLVTASSAGMWAWAAVAGGVALVASMVFSRWYVRQCIRPLLELPDPPRGVWQTEMARTQSAVVRLRGSPALAGNLLGFEEFEYYLLLSVVQAERALEAGDVGSAWAQVQWWFLGLSRNAPDHELMRAVGASLLRVAVLADELGDAERLAEGLEPTARWWERRRTVHGNAPRALGLARALLDWRTGHRARAILHMNAAMRAAPVDAPPHWRYLYARLAEALGLQGSWGRRGRWLQLSASQRLSAERWLMRVCPELCVRNTS